MPRKWTYGDKHFGEYETILFDKQSSLTEELLDTNDEQILDANGDGLEAV